MHPSCSGRRPPRDPPSRSTADSRFRKYKPEEAQAVRLPKVKENAAIRGFKAAWERCRGCWRDNRDSTERPYKVILDEIRATGSDYSAKDVEKFSIVLAQFQDDELSWTFSQRAGLFLSALINNCRDSEFVVHTRHLHTLPEYLGFLNTKNVVVEGNVGPFVAKLMIKGTITVNGNTCSKPGFMMLGGKLVINGKAGFSTGFIMTGGEIHANGDMEIREDRLPDNGKLYHRGELIVDKPDEPIEEVFFFQGRELILALVRDHLGDHK